MAKAKTPTGRRPQTAQPAIAGSAVAADAPAPKKRTSIPQFASQVRAEGRKIVWPSRKETALSTVMVIAMVIVMALFFFVVDQLVGLAVRGILGIGG